MGFYSNMPVTAPGRQPENAPPRMSNAVTGSRDYNPEIGRWNSKDPIGEIASRSRIVAALPMSVRLRLPSVFLSQEYTYVQNCPVSIIDLMGLVAHVVNNTSFRVFIVYNAWLSTDCVEHIEDVKGITLSDGINGMPGVIPPGTDTEADTGIFDVDGYWTVNSATTGGTGMKIRWGKKTLTDANITDVQQLIHGERSESSLAVPFSGGDFAVHLNMWKNDYRLTVQDGILKCKCSTQDLNILDHLILKGEQAIAEFPHAN